MIRRIASSLSLLIAPLALAQEPASPSPSQDAVAACGGRESGASCSVQRQGQSVTGTCRQVPGGAVACKSGPLALSPLPGTLEPCEGQQDGATCGIAGPRGEPLAGICRTGPSGEPAACIPNRRPLPDGTGGGGR